MKTILTRGLAALTMLALAACATTQQQSASTTPGPALWRVADSDTTIYLFGTIHLLPPSSTWRTPVLDKAIGESQSLVVETVIDSANPQQLAAEMASLGFSSGLPPIASRVPAEKVPALEEAIVQTGIPRPLFDRMETWAAAFTLMGVQFQKLGLEGDQGAEAALRRIFTAAGKPVAQLETNREQLVLFDSLSENAQRQLLEGAVEMPETVKEQFGEMLRAWLTGDVEAIAATFNRDLQDSPELKAGLLTRRNAQWASWVQQKLATPGTIFLAVGAGHLAGDVSLQRYLESRGIRVQRIQ